MKIALAKNQKSDPNVCQNGDPNPGQIQGWKPSCPRGAPDPEKTPKSRPKSWKKDPRTTNNLGRKSAGNRHGFCFLNIYSSDFLSRREARCDSKPACKGNLSCQLYLCSASGFAAVDHTSPPSCETSLKARRHTGSTTVRTHAHETFSYSLRKGSLKPCRVH